MSLYSSREPFNDDPEPWTDNATGYRTAQRTGYMASGWSLEPRPEYNRPQNNPTNLILTDIRKNRPEGVSWAKMFKHYNWVTFAAAHYITEDWERITDEDQIDHARKVLTRLAALEKEQS